MIITLILTLVSEDKVWVGSYTLKLHNSYVTSSIVALHHENMPI